MHLDEFGQAYEDDGKALVFSCSGLVAEHVGIWC